MTPEDKIRRSVAAHMAGKLAALAGMGIKRADINVGDHPSVENCVVSIEGINRLPPDRFGMVEFCGLIAAARLTGHGLKITDFIGADRMVYQRAEKLLSQFGEARLRTLADDLGQMRAHGIYSVRIAGDEQEAVR